MRAVECESLPHNAENLSDLHPVFCWGSPIAALQLSLQSVSWPIHAKEHKNVCSIQLCSPRAQKASNVVAQKKHGTAAAESLKSTMSPVLLGSQACCPHMAGNASLFHKTPSDTLSFDRALIAAQCYIFLYINTFVLSRSSDVHRVRPHPVSNTSSYIHPTGIDLQIQT